MNGVPRLYIEESIDRNVITLQSTTPLLEVMDVDASIIGTVIHRTLQKISKENLLIGKLIKLIRSIYCGKNS